MAERTLLVLETQTDLCYNEAIAKGEGGCALKNQQTKRHLAQELYGQGLRIDKIATMLETDPAYVANSLIEAGQAPGYCDLYTRTGPQNRYARMLQGVLRFKDPDAARESVARIDALYHQFEAARDRRGQHQAQLLALTGKNRAEGIGKRREARLFADWLIEHLVVEEEQEAPAAAAVQPRLRFAA